MSVPRRAERHIPRLTWRVAGVCVAVAGINVGERHWWTAAGCTAGAGLASAAAVASARWVRQRAAVRAHAGQQR